MLKRIIKLPSSSFFLFGPRQTGKTTLINTHLKKDAWKVNLLWSDSFLKYSKNPHLFRLEAEEKIKNEKIFHVFIDEIQRIPQLLNEIHYLLETYPQCQFIMTGSSARKLRRGGVNLLAGRAIERFLSPFVYQEVKEKFSLDTILKFGTLPPLLNKSDSEKTEILSAYVNTYLREEIQAEGIARNIGGFSRFLDMAAGQFSEIVNFSSIARDCSLPVRTVQSYYEILEDTLIGFRLESWRKSVRKRLRVHSKFYFFDNGVTNAINTMMSAPINGSLKEKLFEQFIIQEVYRAIRYSLSEAHIYYWRTNHGAEVDLIVEKHGKITAAIEIKSSPVISGAHLSGLRAFHRENENVPLFVVATNEEVYEIVGVRILPWQKFISDLRNLL